MSARAASAGKAPAKHARDYAWQAGKRVRFYVEASVEDKKTTYAAYIQSPDDSTWKHMATFRTSAVVSR